MQTVKRRVNVRIAREPIHLDRSLLTAHHFGFLPIQAPRITKEDLALALNCGELPHSDALGRTAFMRSYFEGELSLNTSEPRAFVYKKPVLKTRPGGYALHFAGSHSGIAEASLIRAAFSILSEQGYKNLRLDINCIGDRESMNLYERELVSAVRKSDIELPEDLKESIRDDVFSIFKFNIPEAITLRESLPSSITFLSPQARNYFKEVLEYIEALGIEFRLAPELVGERNHSSHSVFIVKNVESEIESDPLAIGYRYSRLSRFFGQRKEIPMAGVTIFSKEEEGEKIYKELPRPKFYLIQLGHEAKIRTLSLLELLRSHRIPVRHLLGKDKITAQLAEAEDLRVSHLIIIGQKEALDNTATIRNMVTRAQDTVRVADLPQYLKHIKL